MFKIPDYLYYDKAILLIDDNLYIDSDHYKAFCQYTKENENFISKYYKKHSNKDYDIYYDYCKNIIFNILHIEPIFIIETNDKLIIKNYIQVNNRNLIIIQKYAQKNNLKIYSIDRHDRLFYIDEFNDFSF